MGALCEAVLGRADLATDARFATNPARVAHDEELTGLIELALAGRSSAEVERRLDTAGVANARMRTMAEFAAHPQLAARGRWADVGTPRGEVTALLPPVDVPGRRPRLDPVSDLGEHSAAIRAELGLPEDR
ncbi:CoA transferase [Amycolatopsis sp. cg5]|uniref:CoA transferase n=1 Tax=Amycolatopsis sp. cg5 TaxID=3238802 RepID=UPI003523125C